MKEPLPERRCAFCGDPFIPRKTSQVYDTYDCSMRAGRERTYEKRKAERAATKAAAEAAPTTN